MSFNSARPVDEDCKLCDYFCNGHCKVGDWLDPDAFCPRDVNECLADWYDRLELLEILDRIK